MLLVSLQFVNQTDLKALDAEAVFEDNKQEDIIDAAPLPVSTSYSDYTQFESYNVKSYSMVDAFESVLNSDYGNSIDALSVVNGTLSAKGSTDITGLLVDIDPNSVKEINLSENRISYKIDLFVPPQVNQSSISISNFLNSVVDIKSTDFKLIDVVANEVQLADLSVALGLNPYQILIVASLIEEEAKTEGDRGKIARVIYNRLDLGMPLGIDATIVYALEGDRQLSQSDLEVDSPYNTRIYSGLPPSPIAAPGKLSLEAALNPEVGDWLYYVRTDEFGPGSHTFATTNQEFQQAVQICIERDLGCG